MEKNRVCEVLYAAAWISGEFSEYVLITLVFVGNFCFLMFFRKLIMIIRFIILVSSVIQIFHMLVKLVWLISTYRSNFTIYCFYELD